MTIPVPVPMCGREARGPDASGARGPESSDARGPESSGARGPETSGARAVALLTLLVLLLGACSDGDAGSGQADQAGLDGRGGSGMSGVPEARSLLGEALYALPQDSATAARLYAQLDSAEAVWKAHPDDPDALVWVGRRYAYLGHYRDAIDAFTEGVGRFPDDARFYRHRGHRYISVREFDRAITDLEHAARMTGGQEDVVEPDGQPNDAGVPRSTLQTNIWYHLGLAHYLAGDFEDAVHAYRQGLDISPNDDMRVAMADWLWMALMRLGQEEEADRAIDFVTPDMDILENDAYHRRLLLYRGLLDPDSLAPTLTRTGVTGAASEGDTASEGQDAHAADTSQPETATDRDLQLATYGYGLGNWYLVNGDRDRAREVFENVLETGYWPAFGYIAAEAELARWDDDPGA